MLSGIAAKTICSSPHTSNSIAAFQWAMNPDGNPATIDDMPDAISNSWYDPNVTNECTGIYKTTLDAVEAAGIAVVFSAGNSGPGASTITKPKNINTNEVNVFCVGAIDAALYSGGNNNPIVQLFKPRSISLWWNRFTFNQTRSFRSWCKRSLFRNCNRV